MEQETSDSILGVIWITVRIIWIRAWQRSALCECLLLILFECFLPHNTRRWPIKDCDPCFTLVWKTSAVCKLRPGSICKDCQGEKSRLKVLKNRDRDPKTPEFIKNIKLIRIPPDFDHFPNFIDMRFWGNNEPPTEL